MHSVDRVALVGALGRVGAETGRPVEVYLQVDLGGPEGELAARGGAAPDDVPALAEAVAGPAGLRLAGLMAVAPRGEEPAAAFARLAQLSARLRADHPDATGISAGMSADLEAAVAAGSTLVRVGTAIFGNRPLASPSDATHQPRESHQSHGPRGSE